jgi:hypothetical protein
MSDRTARVVGIVLVAILVLVIAQYLEQRGERFTDSFGSSLRRGPNRVWVDTPEVGPSGEIHVRVAADGGLKARIASLRVTGGRDVVTASGAESWLFQIDDAHGDSHDELEVDLHAPEDARPGDSIPVTIEIDTILAVDAGVGKFRNEEHHDTIAADVDVVTPSGLALRLVWRGASALAVLVVACLASWIAGRRRVRGGVAVLGLASAIGLVFLAGAAFVRPFASATHLYGEISRVTLTSIYVALPVLAFVIAQRRAAAALPAMRVL